MLSTFGTGSRAYKVRTVNIEGDPWFVIADVCKVLQIHLKKNGVVNSWNATRKLDEDEVCTYPMSTNKGDREMLFTSEAGLYKLISRSDKPEAKVFQRWVNHDVLPSIRKTGGYQLAEGEHMPLPVSQADAIRQHAATLLKLADTELDEKQVVTRESTPNLFWGTHGMPYVSLKLTKLKPLQRQRYRAYLHF